MSNAGKKQSSLMLALLPFIVLYVCTVVLVWLSREDMAGTVKYWEMFVPLAAVVALISGWGSAYANGQWRLIYLIKQVIIWGGFIWLLSLLQTLGADTSLGAQKTTFALMFLVALLAIATGLNMDWKMLLFGAFLGLCGYLLVDPSNTAILQPVGDRLGIADAQTKPLSMIIGIAAAAFVLTAFMLITTRASIAAKRRS
ncbi:hypothetical protein D779_1307 [Imhoffiella purpurea]|uniref:Transmembrane protein n=1 Tax=Imhoffiella purpurea TaxID=1249627 RepID=W9VYS9_9GAMM|nr:hypothetical protein D779_1307 [Imhoffiella purpurea]